MRQLFERWDCERCGKTQDKIASSGPDDFPPPGWKSIILNGVAWTICSECVGAFHEWLKSERIAKGQ